MNLHTKTTILASIFALTVGCAFGRNVSIDLVAGVKGNANCECVISKQCTYSGQTENACGSGVLVGPPGGTDAGDYCSTKTAGPADGDECGTGVTGGECENPNDDDNPESEDEPGCYEIKTGSCAMNSASPFGIPYQYCNYTAFNVVVGTGSVRTGPDCPSEE